MKIIIIVLISKKYMDVAEIGKELFEKYWEDCPYSVFYCGDKNANDDYPNYHAFENETTLPARIRKIVDMETPDYVICMLGDAFITNKIKTPEESNAA